MYNRKIDDLLNLLELENTPTAIKNLTESIDRFRKDIQRIETEVVEQKLMDGELKGNLKLSFLERLQQNQKMYKSVIAKRS
jgi:hypothetical protein